MQKDQAYHESAIAYNEGLAEYAETLVPTLEHEEVKRWCAAVGKQHRFHAKRHRSALNKLLIKQIPPPVEVLADGLDVPEPVEDDQVVMPEEKTITPEGVILEDGCDTYHNPTNVNCQFHPKGDING